MQMQKDFFFFLCVSLINKFSAAFHGEFTRVNRAPITHGLHHSNISFTHFSPREVLIERNKSSLLFFFFFFTHQMEIFFIFFFYAIKLRHRHLNIACPFRCPTHMESFILILKYYDMVN